MKLFGIEFGSKKSIVEATAPSTPKREPGAARVKQVALRVTDPGLDYDGMAPSPRKRTPIFDPPEYDLGQIGRAIDKDGYLRRALTKYIQNIWRNGSSITSRNPEAKTYIQNRIKQMELVKDEPWDDFLDECAQQLVYYHNLFLAKVRKEKASGGSRWTTFDGKNRIPIAAYYVQDSTSMEISREQVGGVLIKYRQNMRSVPISELPTWDPADMIHVHLDRKTGLSFGTPMVVPVIADILALRRMEENVEILVFQYAIPFFQYSIGFKDDRSYDPAEIEQVQSDIRNMVTEGMFVTPPHHEIKAIGAEGRAVRVEGYLKYFKQRVFTGLGTSDVGMGEGGASAKATANHLSRAEMDVVERYAKKICTAISFHIFRELLQEGGFDILDDENLVFMTIPPIDVERKMAIENHELALYQGGGITEDEFRTGIGRDPIQIEEREKLYVETVKIPLALIQAVDEGFLSSGGKFPGLSVAIQTAIGKANTAALKAGIALSNNPNAPRSTSTKATEKSTSNRNQPENQSGKKAAKGTKVNDDLEDEEIEDHLNKDAPQEWQDNFQAFKETLGIPTFTDNLKKYYYLTANDAQEYIKDLMSDSEHTLQDFGKANVKLSFDVTTNQIKKKLNDQITNAYTMGYNTMPHQGQSRLDFNKSNDISTIKAKGDLSAEKITNEVADMMVKKVQESTTKSDALSKVMGVFDANRYRIEYFGYYYSMKAFVLGQMHGAQVAGIQQLKTGALGNKDLSCKESQIVNIADLNVDNIPPYHNGCSHVLFLV